MNTFLFSWNPVKFSWPELAAQCAEVKSGERVIEDWSCASHKKVRPGDRAFISLVGSKKRGIFASGHVASEPFIDHNMHGKLSTRVLIEFDVLLNPDHEAILPLALLQQEGRTAKQLWTPQASGILIKPDIAGELEGLWHDFLVTRG